MPIPQTVCSVCGETVNKAQTLHIGDGKRACRKHSETTQKSQEVLAEKQRAELERAKKRYAPPNHADDSLILAPHCGVCNAIGLRQDEWTYRLLVEWQKYEIIHNKHHNIFDPKESRTAAGSLIGVPCLMWVEWKGANTKIRVPFKLYQFIQLQQQILGGAPEGVVPAFLVCAKCVQEAGFKTMAQERDEKMDGEQFWKVAMLLASVSRPLIEETARKELAADN
jgi:hypothetical protein